MGNPQIITMMPLKKPEYVVMQPDYKKGVLLPTKTHVKGTLFGLQQTLCCKSRDFTDASYGVCQGNKEEISKILFKEFCNSLFALAYAQGAPYILIKLEDVTDHAVYLEMRAQYQFVV